MSSRYVKPFEEWVDKKSAIAMTAGLSLWTAAVSWWQGKLSAELQKLAVIVERDPSIGAPEVINYLVSFVKEWE